MSDGAISHDEIDALLSGVSVDGLNSSGHVSGGPAVHIDVEALSKFAESVKDSLAEKLNGMTGVEFSAGTPVVEALDRDSLLSRLPEIVVTVINDYSAGMMGDHQYILAPEFAQKLKKRMLILTIWHCHAFLMLFRIILVLKFLNLIKRENSLDCSVILRKLLIIQRQ